MKINGVIIKESLSDQTVLDKVRIVKTEIWEHPETPYYPFWTGIFFEMEAQENETEKFAESLAKALKKDEEWYIDFHTDVSKVFVVFPGKVFSYRQGDAIGRKEAQEYGARIGIPISQLEWGEG